jgi:4-hydroxy-tetrahydrodipicolinate synthase
MFRGSFVALVTPMFDNGEVDYVTLAELIEFHVDAGTAGIVSVGTTGESATLPFKEHIKVVAKTVELVNGRIPVIAGSGANSTEEAVFLTQQIAALGVDGFLSVVPYYNKPQQRGLVAHFNAVADASDLPLILYNVPSRTVLDMHTSAVVELAKHKNIVGIKDATGDLARLEELKKQLPSEFLLFSGDDATGCDFVLNGGHGVISVTANIAPLEMANMCKLAQTGDAEAARDIDNKLQTLHQVLFIEPNPVMPKWALYAMKKLNSPFLRLPMVIPELNNQTRIEQELKELGLLKN